MLAATAAQAESKYQCKEGETYVMNVMVSGVEYWFPVYEAFKQAAPADGLQDRLYRHAGI